MNKLQKVLCLSAFLALGACAHEPLRSRAAATPEELMVEGSGANNVKDLAAGRSAAMQDAEKNAVRRIAELFMDETSKAENYAALENGPLKSPQLYVSRYKIISEGVDGSLYREKLKVWVYLDKISSALRDLNLSGAQSSRPRAALVSRETGDGSAFAASFKEALSRRSIMSVADFPFAKDKTLAAAGDEALLAAASEAGADLLLSASASAAVSGGGLNTGFYPSKADASVKLYDVHTGKELFSVSRQGSAIDSSEAASFAKSLASAGEVLAQETAAKAERVLKTDAAVLIKVSGLSGIGALEKIKAHFAQLDVKTLRLESYSEGAAVFSVVPTRPDTQELASAALRGDSLGLELEGVSPQEILFSAANTGL